MPLPYLTQKQAIPICQIDRKKEATARDKIASIGCHGAVRLQRWVSAMLNPSYLATSLAYYQVAWTATEEPVLRRELAPLRKIKDNYPKLLLTMDTVLANGNFDGIGKRNVLNWLLQT